MSDKLIQVTDQGFSDAVLKSDKPVVVDFWAPWCKPCQMMAPAFEALAGEYKDQMIFAKMNTDENQMTPGGYGVQGIPTLIFFRNGREIDRIVGLERPEVLRKRIDAALNATV